MCVLNRLQSQRRLNKCASNMALILTHCQWGFSETSNIAMFYPDISNYTQGLDPVCIYQTNL